MRFPELQQTQDILERGPFNYHSLRKISRQLDEMARRPLAKIHATDAMHRCAIFVVGELAWKAADLIERSADVGSGNTQFANLLETDLRPAFLTALNSLGDQDHVALKAVSELLSRYYEVEVAM